MSFKDLAKGVGNKGPAEGSAEGTVLTPGEGALADGRGLDEIATEVIQGKWGVGEERKKKLTEAGYDAAAVQKLVNEMMKK
ncbi:MAG: hypothetical protein J6N53_17190 [Lachnospiraceae bacterium]|nr:hypothetical protein [Lachnospiraceae bacterium]